MRLLLKKNTKQTLMNSLLTAMRQPKFCTLFLASVRAVFLLPLRISSKKKFQFFFFFVVLLGLYIHIHFIFYNRKIGITPF